MSEDKKQRFIIHGGILAIASILVKIIGMIYRIPMINIIGSKGTGIYGTAFNLYNIMLVLSSFGLPIAISALISTRFVRHKFKSARKVMVCSLVIATVTGGIASLLLFFGADFIENVIYGGGVQGVAIPLRVLAPTVFVVAILGVLRGFFQGQETMIPTAVSQLIEQLVNAVVSIAAGYVLVNVFKESENAAAYGAAGSTLGTLAGALSALVFVAFIYFVYRPTFMRMVRKDKSSRIESDGQMYKLIAMTMIPIILSQTFYQISAVIDDAMFSNMMVGKIASIETDLGNYNSSYGLLVGIPQAIASAMAASLLPSIAASYTLGDYQAINGKIDGTLKANMLVAIPSFVGFMVIGQPIIKLLFASYDSVQGAAMLKLGAISVVFYCLSTVTSAGLQGMDMMNKPVKHSLISVVVHVILVFVLLKFTDMGIFALVLGNTTFPIIIFVLNLIELRRYSGYGMDYGRIFFAPSVCSIIMGIATGITYKGIYALIEGNFIALMIALLVAAVTYFGPLLIFRKKGLY